MISLCCTNKDPDSYGTFIVTNSKNTDPTYAGQGPQAPQIPDQTTVVLDNTYSGYLLPATANIKISIVPHHLLGSPRTRRSGTVLDVDDVKAFEIGIDERAPDALVAVHASDEQRRDLRLLQI